MIKLHMFHEISWRVFGALEPWNTCRFNFKVQTRCNICCQKAENVGVACSSWTKARLNSVLEGKQHLPFFDYFTTTFTIKKHTVTPSHSLQDGFFELRICIKATVVLLWRIRMYKLGYGRDSDPGRYSHGILLKMHEMLQGC